MTSYHTDVVGQIDAMSAAQKRLLGSPPPAWTAVQVVRLLPDGGIAEIKVVARRSRAHQRCRGGGRGSIGGVWQMWRSYLTVGVRALVKDRTYAFINIVGLAIGLAACLMLLLYVRYERSYNEWLPNVENVYQLQATLTDPGTRQVLGNPAVAVRGGETLRKDFPQIEDKVYVLGASPIVTRGGRSFNVEGRRPGRQQSVRHPAGAVRVRRPAHRAGRARLRGAVPVGGAAPVRRRGPGRPDAADDGAGPRLRSAHHRRVRGPAAQFPPADQHGRAHGPPELYSPTSRTS
jgi:hypothetical protein